MLRNWLERVRDEHAYEGGYVRASDVARTSVLLFRERERGGVVVYVVRGDQQAVKELLFLVYHSFAVLYVVISLNNGLTGKDGHWLKHGIRHFA